MRFQEDKDGFVLTLDTHLYRPSELYITVKDGNVNITGKFQFSRFMLWNSLCKL